jgi:hypothetical protein
MKSNTSKTHKAEHGLLRCLSAAFTYRTKRERGVSYRIVSDRAYLISRCCINYNTPIHAALCNSRPWRISPFLTFLTFSTFLTFLIFERLREEFHANRFLLVSRLVMLGDAALMQDEQGRLLAACPLGILHGTS